MVKSIIPTKKIIEWFHYLNPYNLIAKNPITIIIRVQIDKTVDYSSPFEYSKNLLI